MAGQGLPHQFQRLDRARPPFTIDAAHGPPHAPRAYAEACGVASGRVRALGLFLGRQFSGYISQLSGGVWFFAYFSQIMVLWSSFNVSLLVVSR